jgi:hypothetical protein
MHGQGRPRISMRSRQGAAFSRIAPTCARDAGRAEPIRARSLCDRRAGKHFQPCRDAGVGAIALGLAMLNRAKRASHIDPPASSYAIMRRARPYRGENPAPGKDVHGELDPMPGIRERPRPKPDIELGDWELTSLDRRQGWWCARQRGAMIICLQSAQPPGGGHRLTGQDCSWKAVLLPRSCAQPSGSNPQARRACASP